MQTSGVAWTPNSERLKSTRHPPKGRQVDDRYNNSAVRQARFTLHGEIRIGLLRTSRSWALSWAAISRPLWLLGTHGRKSRHVTDVLLMGLFGVVGPKLFGPCSSCSSSQLSLVFLFFS